METYFARKPTPEVGLALMEWVDRWTQWCSTSAQFDRWRRSYRVTYGYAPTARSGARSTQVSRGGIKGELALMTVNHYANFQTHILNFIAAEAPAWQPVPTNTDTESKRQVRIGSSLLDFYTKDRKLGQKLVEAAENSIRYGEGFTEKLWDARAGDDIQDAPLPINQETGEPDLSAPAPKEGDLKFWNYHPMDVIRDPNAESWEACNWLMTRKWLNKFELAARHSVPGSTIEGRIIGASAKQSEVNNYTRLRLGHASTYESDDVAVYEFFHKKTDAVPEGRRVLLLDGSLVLGDGSLPYRDVPVYRLAAGELAGTPFGWTQSFDLLGIQELVNALYSIVATNQTTFGVQVITALKGHGVSYKQLAQGLALIEYTVKDGRPEPMNLTLTPREIREFIEKLEASMEVISGINAMVRGQPPKALESGAALAILQAQSIQYTHRAQKAYVAHGEQVAMGVLNDLRDFSTSERVVRTVGKHNKPYVVSFKADDIEGLQRVAMETVSPLSKTTAGRLELVRPLLEQKLITAEQYLLLMKSSDWDSMFEDAEDFEDHIRSENERLLAGEQVPVLITDQHWREIPKHAQNLLSPEARADPNSPSAWATTEHLREHLRQWYMLPLALPGFIEMMGGVPPPMGVDPATGQPMPMQLPPGQGAEPAPPAAISPAAKPKKPTTNNSKPGEAGMPSLPTNPATGETWNPMDGGGMVPQ